MAITDFMSGYAPGEPVRWTNDNSFKPMSWDEMRKEAMPGTTKSGCGCESCQIYYKQKDNSTKMNTINDVKYYKTLKDTPTLDAGAILVHGYAVDGTNGYLVYDKVWVKDAFDGLSQNFKTEVIEKCPDWFERVYLVGGKFLSREDAKKAQE